MSTTPQEVDAGEADVDHTLRRLGLTAGTPVVVLVGGAANLDTPRPIDDSGVPALAGDDLAEISRIATRFLERCLGPAVRGAGAVVLTGGTDAGVMRIAGELLRDDALKLIGVVPKAMVTGPSAADQIEPRHHAVVRTPGTLWGSETRTLFALAEAITGHRAPGLVVVVNGGSITVEEVERFTDGGWPIAVVPGTKGAAELLAVKHADSQRRASETSLGKVLRWFGLRRPPVLPLDVPHLSKRLPGTVDLEVLSPDVASALAALEWRLSTDTLLKSAWTRYGALDAAARTYQRQAALLRRLALVGFLLPVGLATWFVQVQLTRSIGDDSAPADIVGQISAWLRSAMFLGSDDGLLTNVAAVFRVLLIFLPIALALGAAIAAHISPDKRWRATRAGAETLVSRIYRYRAALVSRPGETAAAQAAKAARAGSRLGAVMQAVDTQLLQEGVPLASLGGRVVRERPRDGVHADPLAPLTPRLYLRHRVSAELDYFRDAHRKRDQRERRSSIAAAIVVALAAWTAGTEWAPWFAFLLLAVATFVIVRMRQQVREQLETFDRAVADIEDARLAWDPRTGVRRLVRTVEEALARQGDAWMNNMNRGAKQASDYAAGFSA